MPFKAAKVGGILDSANAFYNMRLKIQSLRKLPLSDNAEESIAGLIWKQLLLGSCKKK